MAPHIIMPSNWKSQEEVNINREYNHVAATQGVDAALAVLDTNNNRVKESEKRDRMNKIEGQASNFSMSGLGGIAKPVVRGFGERSWEDVQKHAGRHRYAWRDGQLTEV